MTDISAFAQAGPENAADFAPALGPMVIDSFWGFTIKNTMTTPAIILFLQGGALLSGAAFIAAIVGLWAAPGAAILSDMMMLRFGLTVFFALMALMLTSYANRGVTSELQIDCNLCEVREVLKTRIGKSALIGQFGFDSFDKLTIDRSIGGAKTLRLILHSHDPAQHMVVATGTEAQIGLLHGRMTRDMMLTNTPAP